MGMREAGSGGARSLDAGQDAENLPNDSTCSDRKSKRSCGKLRVGSRRVKDGSVVKGA